jgi:hypothetical protein
MQSSPFNDDTENFSQSATAHSLECLTPFVRFDFMLKRLVPASIALVGTFFAFVIYWVVFMPWFRTPGGPWTKLIVALAEVAVAIYLFARWQTWPALLLLIGSIPMVLLNISYCGWVWRTDHEGSQPGVFPGLALLFPSSNEHTPINHLLSIASFLLWCLPIAFFRYFFRVADAHLTPM